MRIDRHGPGYAPAPAFQADGLWRALAALDRMLGQAASACAAAAAEADTDAAHYIRHYGGQQAGQYAGDAAGQYHGPYGIDGDGRLARGSAADPGMAPPLAQDARCSWLQQVFGLDAIDLDIIVIALAPEVELRYEQAFAELQGVAAQRTATVDLALNLLCASREAKLLARARFDPHAPLARHRLVQLVPDQGALQPSFLAHGLKLEESVLHFLLGESWLDARLHASARLERRDPPAGARAAALGARMLAEMSAGAGSHFALEGPGATDQHAGAAHLAAQLDMALLTVALDSLAGPATEFDGNLQLLRRDSQLLGAVLYLTGRASLAPAQLDSLAAFLGTAGTSVIVMAGERPCEPRFRTMASIPVAAASFKARRALWAHQLHAQRIAMAPGDIDELAACYRLSEAQIADAVARAARQAAFDHTQADRAQLARAARLQTAGDPGPLARKLTPLYGWDDLVLPGAQAGLLRQLCSQARYRHVVYDDWGFDRKLSIGKGLSALFAGPPGTGKTMAVEVIANDLGLDVFKIDLSQVVSKYIGETEKSLDRLFAEARSSNAILFFDECDALFGKRTAVQDAHDRYANIEVAYLLQKLEEHEGLAILATNLRQNLDAAFTRRLTFIVDFPFPDEASRRRLWQSVFPDQLPRSKTLDLDFMATQFKLSGGAVRNIALAAAFLAARSGTDLRTEHVLWATRTEVEKSGQRLAATEFGRYAADVAALAAEHAP